jgi:hypothetical protein
MAGAKLSDRYYASIPGDDPRFAALREVLASVKQTGRHSPASRMLGEWALLGFLLSTGQLLIGDGVQVPPSLMGTFPEPTELVAARREVAAGAALIGGFED